MVVVQALIIASRNIKIGESKKSEESSLVVVGLSVADESHSWRL